MLKLCNVLGFQICAWSRLHDVMWHVRGGGEQGQFPQPSCCLLSPPRCIPPHMLHMTQPTSTPPIAHTKAPYCNCQHTLPLLLCIHLSSLCNTTASVIVWHARFVVRGWSLIRTSVQWWIRSWEQGSTRYSGRSLFVGRRTYVVYKRVAKQ